MWHRKLFITIMSCLFSCVHSSSSAQTLIEKNNQPKFGIKISCQTCGNMMPFMTPLGSHNTFGSGYPIGVFWQPLKNNSNIADLEVGLFFCSKDVEGNRESIDPDAKMPPCTFKSWNSIPFNVKSIFVPIILKYHPGIKKRFSLNCGLLVSFLVSANAEDPLGELGENRADYHFLKDGSRDPYYLENVDPAYKKERDNFFIEWPKRKNKRKAIPPSNVGKNSRLGLGIEVGLEYETPIGLIINFPCFRFSTHPTEHGAVIAIGYNLGKFCKGGCRSQDLNLVRQAKRL